MERIFHTLYKFFIFWYICGVILVGFDLLPDWLEWSNSVFIITSGLLAWLYFMHCFGNVRGSLVSIGIFVSTFIVEYLGSSTSFLFGDYSYTNQFAPNVFGVPIAIGFAWVMVIATAYALLQYFRIRQPLLRAFIGGVAALLMDLVLDPVAYKVKSYWIWADTGTYYDIPWTNFFGWFIIAFFIHFLLSYINVHTVAVSWTSKLISLYVLIIGMFSFIALLQQLYLASSIGIVTAVCVIFGMVNRRSIDDQSKEK